jgi:hypothetical protein
MFPKYASVFFVYANGILDLNNASVMRGIMSRLLGDSFIRDPRCHSRLKRDLRDIEFDRRNRNPKIVHSPSYPYRIHH